MASTDLRVAAQQALEALEIGYDSAQAEAHQFHAAMAGYKPQRHAAMDADVQKIARAITALKAALVEDAMQKFTDVNQELEAALAEPDLFHCPKCGGPADNGHDRSIPPNPYFCTKCMAEPVQERNFCPRCGKRANDIHTCTPPAPLTDEVIADLWHQNGGFHHHFARAIERWLRGHA